ncbi:hypothetical protein AB1Y20_003889 [Prymnesium parvum]|uniref:Armadillo repeat-containing protein 8 n=1 Tax=Prymnesium parvum TaxID=97485 RepID=A0AB34J859_PRYPA
MVGVETGRAIGWGAGPNVVLPVFEAFQSARVDFAMDIAKLAVPEAAPGDVRVASGTFEVACTEKVLEALENSSTLAAELLPLVGDLSPQVSECALLAVGRVGALSQKLHLKLTDEKLIAAAVGILSSSASATHVKAALFELTVATKASEAGAQLAIQCNALPPLCERLDSADTSVRVATVWCLGTIADHSPETAHAVLDCGAPQLVLLCLKEDPSLVVRRVCLSMLGSTCKHGAAYASPLQKCGLLDATLPLVSHRDPLVRRHACRTLALACQHAEAVSEWLPHDARPALVECMRTAGSDRELAACAATLLQILAKGSIPAAVQLYELGAVQLLVDFISQRQGRVLPCCLALVHILTASRDAAALALSQGAMGALVAVCASGEEPHVCAAAVEAMGVLCVQAEGSDAQIAKEGALQAAVLSTILAKRPLGAVALSKARTGIAKIIQVCTSYDDLVWLLETLPFPTEKAPKAGDSHVLIALLKRLAVLLSTAGHGKQRLDFVNRGALAKAQQAKSFRSTEIKDALKQFNVTFPAQMVAATDPDYERKLLDKIA